MLMLTHTYLLQNVLGTAGSKNYDLDIFVYNITPDLLPMNSDINPQQTHKIRRFSQIPPFYPKTAYTMFHLLVDDLAHYGEISPGIPAAFNPDSRGYSYIKGKPLINSILDFQKEINKEISYNEAVYRSHLIVEMIYDLVIIDNIKNYQTMELLAEAIFTTAEKKMDEFAAAINWLYGLDKRKIREVLRRACTDITYGNIQKIMNIEGRIHLYARRFGLDSDEQLYFAGIKNIFLQARELLDDHEIFLRETVEAVKKYGWRPPIT